MTTEYQLTVRLSDEDHALLDRARGNADLATYLVKTAIKDARRKATRMVIPPLLDESDLTPEEHMRMAAEAHEDGMELEQFVRVFRERVAQKRAASR